MTRDYMIDLSAFDAMYGAGAWEDETVATFQAKLDLIPTLWMQQNGTWGSTEVNEAKGQEDNRKFLIAARFPSLFSDPFADDDGIWD